MPRTRRKHRDRQAHKPGDGLSPGWQHLSQDIARLTSGRLHEEGAATGGREGASGTTCSDIRVPCTGSGARRRPWEAFAGGHGGAAPRSYRSPCKDKPQIVKTAAGGGGTRAGAGGGGASPLGAALGV